MNKLYWRYKYLPHGNLFAMVLVATLLQGCNTVTYYSKSIKGHYDLMGQAEPISSVVSREETTPELRATLKLAVLVRDFASSELRLPNNGSYRSYADLKRDQVSWIVVATPPFSVEPYKSCFLVVGCLSYRGFFSKEDAVAFAAELKMQGLESYIGRSTAYSTLGWFNDPLLNTIIKEGELRMVEVIFHELAHQQLYINGDSTFNESFATAVAQIGSKRCFERQGEAEKYQAYLKIAAREHDFNRLLINRRDVLAKLYQSDIKPDAMLINKEQQFAQLQVDYLALKLKWNGYNKYDAWMAQPLNNAHLALSATYEEYAPAFIKLFEDNDSNFAHFYLAAKRMEGLTQNERNQVMTSLLKRATPKIELALIERK
jgi:predicted aminopeptidase